MRRLQGVILPLPKKFRKILFWQISCSHAFSGKYHIKFGHSVNFSYIYNILVIGKVRNCGMRKVKCGIEKCGNGCGMVGIMRNAEKVKWGVNRPIIQYLDHA